MAIKKAAVKKPAAKKTAAKTVKKPATRKPAAKKTIIIQNQEEQEEFDDPAGADWAEGLAIDEARFVQELVNVEYNGTEAMLRIRPHKTRCSAQKEASVMRNRPHVQAALKKYLDTITSEYKEKLRVKYMETMATRAFFDPQDLIDESGNLKTSRELGRLAVAVDDVYCIQKKGRGQTRQPKVADREKALSVIGQLVGITENEDAGQTRVVILTGTLSHEEWTKQAEAMKK